MTLPELIVDSLLQEAPDLEKLKKHRQTLTPEEKAAFPKNLPRGDGASILKAEVDGKTWYAVYTHRACQIKPTLKGAVAAYPFIASTS